MRAAHLYVYPIKSCGGAEVDQLRLGPVGVANDRTFVLVDEDGFHITQREAPRLAAVHTSLEPHGVRVVAPGGREIVLPYGAVTAGPRRCESIETTVVGWIRETSSRSSSGSTWSGPAGCCTCRRRTRGSGTRQACRSPSWSASRTAIRCW
jgi:MOSC N-terminal beta barrel domain